MTATDVTAERPRAPGALREGRTPVATPAVLPAAVLLALLLLAGGQAGVRDDLAAAGALRGSSWTATAARHIDGATPQVWMVPAGVALVLVGLWWLVLTVKPRRRTELEMESGTSVWLRPADVARLATATAEDVPGVVQARSTASRRVVTVTAQTTAHDTTQVRQQVTEAVTARLAGLRRTPRITVRAHSMEGR